MKSYFLKLWLFIMLLVCATYSQATSLTGSVTYNTSVLNSGSVHFTLLGCSNPSESKSLNVPPPSTYNFKLTYNGTFNGAGLVGNDVIYCSGMSNTTYYEVQAYTSAGALVWDRYYRVGGSIWSIATASVLTNFSINSYLETNPSGDQVVTIPSNNKLSILGGKTLITALALGQDPVNSTDAVTKNYVDNQILTNSGSATAVLNKVNKTGDTMTGALVLPGDPTSALEAAPKQYVDSNVATLSTQLVGKESTSNKNQPNGYAGLDSSGNLLVAATTAAAFNHTPITCSNGQASKGILANGDTAGCVVGGSIPTAGIAVSNGSTWTTSIAAPSTAIVGVSDTQTLINKTVDTATPTEVAYVHGVRSSIQGQFDALSGPQFSLPCYQGSIVNSNYAQVPCPNVNVDDVGNVVTSGTIGTPYKFLGSSYGFTQYSTSGSLGTTLGLISIGSTSLNGVWNSGLFNAQKYWLYQSDIGIFSTNVLAWGPFSSSGQSNLVGTADLGLSRTAAGTIAVGNGTLGDTSGTLKATNLILTGTCTGCGTGGGSNPSATGIQYWNGSWNLATGNQVEASINDATTTLYIEGGYVAAPPTPSSTSDQALTINSSNQLAIDHYISGSWTVSAICTADGQNCPLAPNGTITIPSATYTANTCSASTLTLNLPGVTSSATFSFSATTDTASLTGWGSTGGLTIEPWPTANTMNYKVCNQTGSSITSSSITFNVSFQNHGVL